MRCPLCCQKDTPVAVKPGTLRLAGRMRAEPSAQAVHFDLVVGKP
jgi:hypothetical protein